MQVDLPVGCSTIDFGDAVLGEDSPLDRNCLLKNREHLIQILALRSSDPHMHATARSLLDGTHHVLKLTYDGGGPPGRRQGMLYVETDDPHQPTLEIPFRYRRGEP